MTTPTVENTVFIVAPEVKPELCETGENIRKRRAEAVRVATIDSWWQAEAEGYLEYIRHCVTCVQCGEVELAKRQRRWEAIEAQETK